MKSQMRFRTKFLIPTFVVLLESALIDLCTVENYIMNECRTPTLCLFEVQLIGSAKGLSNKT